MEIFPLYDPSHNRFNATGMQEADRFANQAKNDGRAQSWLDAFNNPPFYSDMVNQEVYPAEQADIIPEGFRVPITSKELAEIWKRSR